MNAKPGLDDPAARESQPGLTFQDVSGRIPHMAQLGEQVDAAGGDPEAALSAQDVSFWRSLGSRFVSFGNGPGAFQDIDGYYGRLMDEYGCDVILKRPDYYIFGACKTLSDLPALLDELRQQLTGD